MCEGQVAGTPVEGALRGVRPRRWLPAALSPALNRGSGGSEFSKDEEPPPLYGPVLGLHHPPGEEILLIWTSDVFAAGDTPKCPGQSPREALPCISSREEA